MMHDHGFRRLGLLLIAACLPAGCASSPLWPTPNYEASKIVARPTDNEAVSAEPSVWGAARPMRAAAPAEPVVLAGHATPPTQPPLTLPREAPPYSGAEPVPGLESRSPLGPHARTAPTATGGLLNLAPGETPIDRAVELARRLAAAEDENRILTARIVELEAVGRSREHSVAEMVREVETASGEVQAATAELRAQRAEIASLKARIQKMEQDELELLKALIDALKQAVRPSAGRGEEP